LIEWHSGGRVLNPFRATIQASEISYRQSPSDGVKRTQMEAVVEPFHDPLA